jgi:hypothetical protein
MSLTTCRGCGQPLTAEVSVCGVCGVRVTEQTTAPVTEESQAQFVQKTYEDLAPAPAVPPVVAAAAPPVATAAAANVIRLKGRHIALLSGLVALFLIGAITAGAMSAPDPKPAGELVGQLPFGPEGGTQAFDGGAGKIKVPKGALSGPKTIEVRRTIIRERVTAQSLTGTPLIFPAGSLIAYTFGPITLVLNRPVTIVLRLPQTDQGGLIFVTSNGQIRYFPGRLGGSTITLRLNSFDLSRPGAIVQV